MNLKPIARRVNILEGTDAAPKWVLLGPAESYGDGFTHEALYTGEQVAALRAEADAKDHKDRCVNGAYWGLKD